MSRAGVRAGRAWQLNLPARPPFFLPSLLSPFALFSLFVLFALFSLCSLFPFLERNLINGSAIEHIPVRAASDSHEVL